MKIVIVGASGTIGKELVSSFENDHEVIKVGLTQGDYTVDMQSDDSIESLFKDIGEFDALISVAGNARFVALGDLKEDDFEFTFKNKLMGQIKLFLVGKKYAKANTSFTLTSGILAQEPMVGSAVVSLVNAGLESFAKAAALELGDIRLNVVTPVFAKETMDLMGMDSTGATSAKEFVPAYQASIEDSSLNGQTVKVTDYL